MPDLYWEHRDRRQNGLGAVRWYRSNGRSLKVGGRVRVLQRHHGPRLSDQRLDFTKGAELQIAFYGLVTNPAYGHGGKIAERLITAGLHHIAGGGGKFLPLATLPSPKTPPPPSSRVAAAGSINLKP
jgi:hypothetical protein